MNIESENIYQDVTPINWEPLDDAFTAVIGRVQDLQEALSKIIHEMEEQEAIWEAEEAAWACDEQELEDDPEPSIEAISLESDWNKTLRQLILKHPEYPVVTLSKDEQGLHESEWKLYEDANSNVQVDLMEVLSVHNSEFAEEGTLFFSRDAFEKAVEAELRDYFSVISAPDYKKGDILREMVSEEISKYDEFWTPVIAIFVP